MSFFFPIALAAMSFTSCLLFGADENKVITEALSLAVDTLHIVNPFGPVNILVGSYPETIAYLNEGDQVAIAGPIPTDVRLTFKNTATPPFKQAITVQKGPSNDLRQPYTLSLTVKAEQLKHLRVDAQGDIRVASEVSLQQMETGFFSLSSIGGGISFRASLAAPFIYSPIRRASLEPSNATPPMLKISRVETFAKGDIDIQGVGARDLVVKTSDGQVHISDSAAQISSITARSNIIVTNHAIPHLMPNGAKGATIHADSGFGRVNVKGHENSDDLVVHASAPCGLVCMTKARPGEECRSTFREAVFNF